MTPSVKATSRRPTLTTERALEALAAADIYTTRLVSALGEIGLAFEVGEIDEASESLAGAVSGIRCLADILASVGRATGIDTSPSADHEIGHIALCLQEVERAQGRKDYPHIARLIEQDLVPALSRLAPTFPHLEAQVAAIA